MPNNYTRFQDLFTKYRVHLERFVGRLCQDPELAGDLTQETFLRAFKYIDSLRENRGETLGWLYGIARNVWKDHLRRSGRLPTDAVGVEDGGFDPADMRPAHTTQVEEKLMTERIRGILAQMPEPDRSVLVMRRIHGASVQETADRLGLSPRTVNRKLAQALVELRSKLSEERIIPSA